MNLKVFKINDLVMFEKVVNGNNGLDLQEIGLLTFFLTRKDDEQILKTQLHEVFGRRRLEAAWKGLHDKGYMFSILVQGSGSRYYLYYVNYQPFTKEEVMKTVSEVSLNHDIKKVDVKDNLRPTEKGL